MAIDRDKWPPTPSTTYIRLALVKKEKVSRGKADHFTRLTLQGDIDMILKVKQPITMEEVLKGNNTRLVVVEGAPGIGKSTFAWELCRQWPTLESMRRFSLVVLLRLREEGVQTATAISDLFCCRDDPSLGRCVGGEMGRRMGEGVLFVFDGFDEFPAELRRKSFVAEVIIGSYLPKATVLVTSRPSTTAELLSVCGARMGKHIEVVGFSDKEVKEYAESIFGSGSELLASLQTYLSVNPVVRGMMYNPLNCAMVVEVYRNSSLSHRAIPHTLTQLYTELSLCLLSQHLSAAGDPLARRLPDRLEDIPHDSDLYQQLVRLGRLAFEGRVRGKVIFRELPKGCSDLGLLNTCSELYGRRENVTYNFLHLTLQEYLGAFYISQLPASEQGKLFVKYRELGHLNVVWRFVAGLTRMQAIGWEGFRGRMVDCRVEDINVDRGCEEEQQTEDEGEDNVHKWTSSGYEVVDGEIVIQPFVVQCLYEAQDAESCASVFSQLRVEYHGWEFSTPFDAYAVGYCVSLCRNVWKINMGRNGFGPEVVEMLVRGLKSVQYGGGSVEELWLSGNTITDEGMRFLQQFPHQILQHIRTLHLSDCDLDQTEFDLLADTLPLLSSLELLDIYNNPGGNGSTVKLLQALETHQTIQHLMLDRTVIGRDDVMVLSDVVKTSGSLRELWIGNESDMSPECMQQLVSSPSSLRALAMWVPSSVSPLDYIKTISDNLTRLEFRSFGEPESEELSTDSSEDSEELSTDSGEDSEELSTDSSEDSKELPTEDSKDSEDLLTEDSEDSEEQPTELSCSKLSDILKENTTLKVLGLRIPLRIIEVRAIVKSLKHNHTLTELRLSRYFHSECFSELDQQAFDCRITWGV